LARRNLIVQASLKVDPDDIREEIFRPKRLRYPVVQPAGSTGRVFSTVIDENFTQRGPRLAPRE
jgi:hypothetical protein